MHAGHTQAPPVHAVSHLSYGEHLHVPWLSKKDARALVNLFLIIFELT
jgi:hypothetical protein